jgi:UDP-glucose 4-epimerase
MNKQSVLKKISGTSIVVTGGAGFIGSHLTERLLNLNVRKITVIDSLDYGREKNINSDGRVVFLKFKIGADPINDLKGYLDNSDCLFHLAAEKHNPSAGDPHSLYKVNIIGTSDLFELAGKCNVRKVVFSSSLHVYGQTDYPPMKESDTPNPNNIYGISKLSGEHLLSFYARKYGFDFTILRYFFTYGPRQFSGFGHKPVIVGTFSRMLHGLPAIIIGDGRQSMDYLYIDDLIDATVESMASNFSGEIFNVGSSTDIMINELMEHMIQVFGKSVTVCYAPPDRTAHHHYIADIHKIQTMLSWKPKTSIEQGLQKTLDWMQRENDDNH